MPKAKLKIGDTVRIKVGKKVGTVVDQTRDGNTVYVKMFGSVSVGYARHEVRKIPIQSPASKLAAVNNFWQGRAGSIRQQINSLIKDMPVPDKTAVAELRSAAHIILYESVAMNDAVKEKLEELKSNKESEL